jgi:mRNA-degrading endonuclease RelE of RelBE toxin-antitoxin system
MTTPERSVRHASEFDTRLKRLSRKYPGITQAVERLEQQLERGETPGDQIPGVHYPVYKVRLPNRAAKRGKRGGLRAIYYVRTSRHVWLLTIYSKTEHSDIAPEQIQRIIEQLEDDQ